MVKCLEHHRITFSFLIIRALLVFFLLLACPCPHHNLLKCHEQFAVVIQHPTLQLMHKRRDQIKTKSLYCHNTMNARVQVVKVFRANSADSMDDKYWIYMQHIYMYTYRLNTCREQYMVNIILCREHEMKTIINTITVHIRAARYLVWDCHAHRQ